MMKVLIIIANPRKEAYTRELLQGFLESYRQYNPDDEFLELDLYQMEIPVIDDAILQAWNKKSEELSKTEQQLLAQINHFTDQFITADKVVFAAPMWNLQFPPMLLAYIANIAVVRKTFCYTEHGCQGLVPNKPVLLLHVRGGVFSSGPAQAFDHAVPYLKSLCNLLGITNFQTVICEGVEMFPGKARQILAQSIKDAKQVAKYF